MAEIFKTEVQKIIPYLEDMSNDAFKVIYFNGWDGLAASAVLRAIAEHPPPYLLSKFDKIVHIDCSRWKSRRALQRAIADELNLTQLVAADFDKQDEADDYRAVDQGSRDEIRGVTTVIARFLAQYRCLVIFHNGSDHELDLTSCGIPQPEIFGTKVLWTFGGRLRIVRDSTPISGFILRGIQGNPSYLLEEEAREISLYTRQLGFGIAPEIAKDCCRYLLSLSYLSDGVIDYNWPAHASSYWVCDGIIQGGQGDRAWEIARALHQQIRVEDYKSSDGHWVYSSEHWVSIISIYFREVAPGTTSLFFSPRSYQRYISVPNSSFHEAHQLRVLKLCFCTFSFSSPPFHCCHNLRFLGLDRCKDDDKQQLEEENTGAQAAVERLWVLDVCQTDLQLPFLLQKPTVDQEQSSIGEVHTRRRRLPYLRRLRVSSWRTIGKDDEFVDMVNLESLDLSGSDSMQVLPNLSGATNLKTLVLDECSELKYVGPQGLPPSLESFSFAVSASLSGFWYGDRRPLNRSRISRISLAGCARLSYFRLDGSYSNLEELDLSHTALKMLDLKRMLFYGDDMRMGNLKRIFLMECEQLRHICWPQDIHKHQLRLLCIDNRAGGDVGNPSSQHSLMPVCQGKGGEGYGYGHAFVSIEDMRFLQSIDFLYRRPTVKMNLCYSSKKMGRPYSSTGSLELVAAAAAWPLPKPLAYHDVSIQLQMIATKIDDDDDDGESNNVKRFQPLDYHMEIGEGVCDVPEDAMTTHDEKVAMCRVLNMVQSLHVNDTSSIATVLAAEYIIMAKQKYASRQKYNASTMMNSLKWCRVERCSKLDTVFVIIIPDDPWSDDPDVRCFTDLETFSAAHLLTARSIWRRPAARLRYVNSQSFGQLKSIHIYLCPRLRYVIPLLYCGLPKRLETLHILYCSDLEQVFPVEQKLQRLEFPKLKDLYLQELPNLQLICEAKMSAPNLETIHLRGCWSLRRLPATDNRRRLPVAVDCEKDFWDKLEWDGMESGHHPSLFQPRHSKHYRKRHLRGTVLR